MIVVIIVISIIFLLAIFGLTFYFSSRNLKKTTVKGQDREEKEKIKAGKDAENMVTALLLRLDGKLITSFRFYDHHNNPHDIDQIFINKAGVFVIETKSFNGRVTGFINEDKWTYTNKYKCEERYSPYKQNDKHVTLIQEMLNDNSIPLFNVVVFVNGDVRGINHSNVMDVKDLASFILNQSNEMLEDDVIDIYNCLINYNDSSITDEMLKEYKNKLTNQFNKNKK